MLKAVFKILNSNNGDQHNGWRKPDRAQGKPTTIRRLAQTLARRLENKLTLDELEVRATARSRGSWVLTPC